MSIIDLNNIIRENPLDTNQNIQIGVVFPLMNEGTFLSSTTFKEQVKTNMLMVLLTEKGERVFNPEFGIGLRQILFETAVDPEEVRQMIENQLSFYVPEIELIDVFTDFNPDQHTLKISITYSLLTSGEKDSIVVNVGGTGEGTNLNNSVGS
jgi:phage baseplate assembly protein W